MSNRDDSNNDLLTAKEAAHRMRCHTSTLERMRCQGTGPTYIKLGPGKRAKILYPSNDLTLYLASNRRRSTSDRQPPPEDAPVPEDDQ